MTDAKMPYGKRPADSRAPIVNSAALAKRGRGKPSYDFVPLITASAMFDGTSS